MGCGFLCSRSRFNLVGLVTLMTSLRLPKGILKPGQTMLLPVPAICHWNVTYTDPQWSGCDHMTGKLLIMIDWIDGTEHRLWISVFG